MEKEKIDLIIRKNTKSFFIEKSAEKKELTNCESKWEDTTDNKIQNVFFFKDWKKKKDGKEYRRLL